MYNVLFSRAISYAKQCDLYAISAPSDVNMVLWTKVVVFRHAGQRLFFAGQRKSNGEGRRSRRPAAAVQAAGVSLSPPDA